MRLALFEPDIAQNAGTMMRLAACLGLSVDLIEPCGFIGDAKFRRSAMDYLDRLDLVRHRSWAAFQATRLERPAPGRLILLTTRGAERHVDARFMPDDTLLVGRESAGVPDAVHRAADLRLRIPMQPGLRSINVALAAAMVVGEALRQTDLFAEGPAS
ncbi:MAG TPA: tRNA (cytidine(34)-2'-O)-methyltransferase [Aliidongia sp.]|uniref:tRNA (cytidine(34)-2'-O)-methyltransferase n=1 Tax=Aliidongia sp. TaxID=1914230 RepID=UPI002DDCEB91|nr:tRNA (cytidine(34)-2'-O)-methyltransferase [Aliidongia sp.]HEV2677849.1 tRNA (cytidine(34)-2'-O)-methyltransferase [Aliidongia sp.]